MFEASCGELDSKRLTLTYKFTKSYQFSHRVFRSLTRSKTVVSHYSQDHNLPQKYRQFPATLRAAVAHKQNFIHYLIYKIPQTTNFANLLSKPYTIWQKSEVSPNRSEIPMASILNRRLCRKVREWTNYPRVKNVTPTLARLPLLPP